MQEIKAVHRVHRKPDGNPVRREFTLRTWQLLPTKTINGVTYPKMGYELESSVQKEFIKENDLDVKTAQPKDDILADLKNLGYE